MRPDASSHHVISLLSCPWPCAGWNGQQHLLTMRYSGAVPTAYVMLNSSFWDCHLGVLLGGGVYCDLGRGPLYGLYGMCISKTPAQGISSLQQLRSLLPGLRRWQARLRLWLSSPLSLHSRPEAALGSPRSQPVRAALGAGMRSGMQTSHLAVWPLAHGLPSLALYSWVAMRSQCVFTRVELYPFQAEA